MSNEDWNGLPDWSDVEDNPVYNVHVPSRGELHGRPPATHLGISLGFTEVSPDARDSSSMYSDHPQQPARTAIDSLPVTPTSPATSTSNQAPRMLHIGRVNSRSVLMFLETPAARRHVRGTDGNGQGSHVGSTEDESHPELSQEHWWSVYHNTGDVVRDRSRPVWVITPGRPPTPDPDAVRRLFREDTPTQASPTQSSSSPTQSDPTQSDPTQSDPTQSDPTQSDPKESDSAEAVHPNLRGGGGSVHSELFDDCWGLPCPADWLQLLRAQGDHQTVPFRFGPSMQAKTRREDALSSPMRPLRAHLQRTRERLDYDEPLANRLDQERRGRPSQRQSSGLTLPPPVVVHTTSLFRENYMIDGRRKHDHDRFGVPDRHRSVSASLRPTSNHDFDDRSHGSYSPRGSYHSLDPIQPPSPYRPSSSLHSPSAAPSPQAQSNVATAISSSGSTHPLPQPPRSVPLMYVAPPVQPVPPPQYMSLPPHERNQRRRQPKCRSEDQCCYVFEFEGRNVWLYRLYLRCYWNRFVTAIGEMYDS
ncbi:hypothetical protein P3342_012361 [Pyrenophora teres f. teres]|nr:hypothetical protein P3342_012361 [Pyrenophora teres f. teres]